MSRSKKIKESLVIVDDEIEESEDSKPMTAEEFARSCLNVIYKKEDDSAKVKVNPPKTTVKFKAKDILNPKEKKTRSLLNKFNQGQKVIFGRKKKKMTGIITKFNKRSITIKTETNDYYRCSPSLIEKYNKNKTKKQSKDLIFIDDKGRGHIVPDLDELDEEEGEDEVEVEEEEVEVEEVEEEDDEEEDEVEEDEGEEWLPDEEEEEEVVASKPKQKKCIAFGCRTDGQKPSDNYVTPLNAWKDILQFFSKSQPLWLPFYHKGEAKELVESLGYTNVYHQKKDYFTYNLPRMIIDNPPFSIKKDIIEREFKKNKPFALLLPLQTLERKYMIKCRKNLQLLFSNSRYTFKGEKKDITCVACWFCWNMSGYLKTKEQIIYVDDINNVET